MPEPLTDERLDALEAEWSDAWEGLDDTPMMPTSKADPAYGGREHRMIASAPRTILALIAEVRRLRAALQKRLVTKWRSGHRVYYQCDECGQRADAPERIEHIACPLSDAALAERGGEG